MTPPDPTPVVLPVGTLPLLPLKNTVLFPYLFAPLAVGRPASQAAVDAAHKLQPQQFMKILKVH